MTTLSPAVIIGLAVGSCCATCCTSALINACFLAHRTREIIREQLRIHGEDDPQQAQDLEQDMEQGVQKPAAIQDLTGKVRVVLVLDLHEKWYLGVTIPKVYGKVTMKAPVTVCMR